MNEQNERLLTAVDDRQKYQRDSYVTQLDHYPNDYTVFRLLLLITTTLFRELQRLFPGGSTAYYANTLDHYIIVFILRFSADKSL